MLHCECVPSFTSHDIAGFMVRLGSGQDTWFPYFSALTCELTEIKEKTTENVLSLQVMCEKVRQHICVCALFKGM